jgi:hypothetical protein
MSQKSIQFVCEDHNICDKELSVELKVFSEMCMEQNMSSNLQLWLGNFMQLQLLDSFPNMTEIYKLFLTVLMSSASSERLFSSLRRVSSYSRSRMGQERLRSVAVLAIEWSDSIDISQIIDVFDSEAEQRGRRLQLISHPTYFGQVCNKNIASELFNSLVQSVKNVCIWNDGGGGE